MSVERTGGHVVHATTARWVLLRRDDCVALVAFTDVGELRCTGGRAR